MINVGGGYVESKYVVARRSGSSYSKLYAVTSVSVNVVEDNTSRYWLFGWHEGGSVNNYGGATSTYNVSRDYEDGGDISADVARFGFASKNIKPNSPGQIYRFEPKVSGSYLIRPRSSAFLDVTVHNATINQSTGTTWTHTINLTAGHVYYIETAATFDSYRDYSVSIAYSPSASAVLAFNVETSA